VGRRRARQIEDDARDRLQRAGISLDRLSALSDGLTSEMLSHFGLRRDWEAGSLEGLPDTDVGDQILSIAELVGVAHTSAFLLRRTSDGLSSSRPLAIDALRIYRRCESALTAMAGLHGLNDVPKRLRDPVSAVALGLFELARSLVQYLVTQPAPDLAAGRDSVDGWLDVNQTSEERNAALAAVTLSHRVLERLRNRDADLGSRDSAAMFAQRIAAAFQSASCEVSQTDIGMYLRERHWLDPAEISTARSYFEEARHSANSPQDAELALAAAMINIAEDGTADLLDEFRAAAAAYGGLNRVGMLRTLVNFVEDPNELEVLAYDLLTATASGASCDAATLRVQALPQLLNALAAISLHDAAKAALLARRIAGLADSEVFTHDHLWIIPARTPVALIEWRASEPEVIALPDLNDPAVVGTLINEHAEDFERAFDVSRLRQRLTALIQPLRSVLADASAAMSFHGFGWTKHIPIAALTGRGSILAISPGMYVFAPGPPPETSLHSGRVLVVDRELYEDYPVQTTQGAQVVFFDSRDDGTDALATMRATLASGDLSELVFFGHGHVDQFNLLQTGLVIGIQAPASNAGDDSVLLIPSVAIAGLDLRAVRLALVMACGAGRGCPGCRGS